MAGRVLGPAVSQYPPPIKGVHTLVDEATGQGIRFRQAAWPALPEEVEVATRRRWGAWARKGVVSQDRARQLWLEHRALGWTPKTEGLLQD